MSREGTSMQAQRGSRRRSTGTFLVSHYLHEAASRIPPALVSPTALARIRALTDRLPGGITSFFGFECPLGSPAASADFLLCSTRVEGHARILAGRHPRIGLPAGLLAQPAWERVEAFCRAWEDPGSLLHEGVLNTWLEFDVGSNPTGEPAPSMFFGTAPGDADPRPIDHLALVREALGRLDPLALAGARGDALPRTLERLPDGCHVFQIGAMLARAMPAIRICVRGLPAPAIGSTLAALGWSGPRAELDRLVETLSPLALRIDLDLDLGVQVGPKIGLECYFGTDPETTGRLRRIGAHLVEQRLCTPAKADALLGYGGLTHQDGRPATWPSELRALAAAQGRGVASCLCRWVHHIKVVYEPGRPLAAKAYLAIEHHLLDRRRLAAAIATARAR